MAKIDTLKLSIKDSKQYHISILENLKELRVHEIEVVKGDIGTLEISFKQWYGHHHIDTDIKNVNKIEINKSYSYGKMSNTYFVCCNCSGNEMDEFEINIYYSLE